MKLPTTPQVESRLAAYVTLAGVALAGAPAARATFIYSGPININIPSTTAGIYINLLTGVFGTSAASVPGWDLSPWGTTTFNVWANNPASPNSGVITNWPGGSSATLVDNIYPVSPEGASLPIDSSWNYGRTNSIETTGATAFLLNSNQNYVGFRFLNEATGQYNYAWAHFSLGSSFGGQPRTLIDYLYENNGNGIIPEPSTMTLLGVVALGAVGIRAWRKRFIHQQSEGSLELNQPQSAT
jgi:hypothetical protein